MLKRRDVLSILVIAMGIPVGRAYGDTIERRGTEPKLEGRVAKIDDAGVELSSESGARYTVPWDRVRRVVMDHSSPALDEFKETAANLWRARTRLERNDAALAEPLFERLFEAYRGRKHETALVVCEGLLRCRLARGGQDLAVIPALEVARLRRAGIKTASYSTMPPVLDERTGLCTSLAPAWATVSGLIKVEHDLASYDAQGDTAVAALATLYRQAIRRQLGMELLPEEKPLAADQPGVILLRTILDLSSKDAKQRNSARDSLTRDLASLPNWAQAWTRYFIGVSLLAESGVGRQQSGLLSLAYLPARFGSEQPYLAGLALAKLAEACDTSGETAAATSLRADLASRFPNHPVLSAVNRTASAATTRSGPATAASTTSPAMTPTSVPSSKESP